LPHADSEKTVQHAVRAAEAAAAVHAHDEAARFYGIALDAVRGAPDVPPARLADLWILLARALVAAGRSAEAEDAALHVRSLAARAGAPALLAEAGLALRPTGRLWQSGDVVSRAMLDDALPGLPDDARALRARALSSLSMSLPLTISDAMRHDLVARAVDASRGVSDPATIAIVHAARLNALLDPAKVDALVGAASEVIEVALAERLPELEISARTLRALGLLTRGEIDAASTEYDEIHRVSTEVKNPLTVWRADVARAGIALGRGGLAEAESEFRSIYARGRRFHGALANLVFRAQMQELDALRGRTPAPTRFDPDGFVERFDWAGATVSSYVALHQLDAGDRASAERAFERLARDDFGGIPRSIGYLAVLRALAFVAIGLGDLPRAERIHADLSPHAHLNAIATSSLYYGPVSYLLGRLEVLLGRAAAARGHFEQAYESAAASGMQPMMARSQEALGRLLSEKGGADGRLGERHLEEAAGLARRLGLGALRLV
jgi:tetratricopeptide (TPR) repeat protein